MSKFHSSVRDLFEDVFHFLTNTLQNEILSSLSLTEREKLLGRLLCLQQDYPELQLTFSSKIKIGESKWDKTDSSRYSPSSPVPYVDMNQGSPYKIPPFSQNVSFEDTSYDLCSAKAKSEKSLTESEDYMSDDAKNLPYVSASDLADCDKAGYLDKKKRESLKGWLNPFQKRWCAIKDGILYYYEKTSDRRQRGCIILAGYEARPLLDDNNEGKKYSHCFELVCPGKRTYQFSASSEKDVQQWISAIEKNCKITYLGKSPNQTQINLSKSNYSSNTDPDLSYDADDIYETVLEEEDKPNVLNEVEESFADEDYSDVDAPENQIFNYSECTVYTTCVNKIEVEMKIEAPDLRSLSTLQNQLKDKFSGLQECQERLTGVILQAKDSEKEYEKDFTTAEDYRDTFTYAREERE